MISVKLNEILLRNKDAVHKVLWTNESDTEISAMLLVDPLKLVWCDHVFMTAVYNPRIEFDAAIRYAESMWRVGFIIDTPILLNVNTTVPSDDFNASYLNTMYGYDGATRLLAIKLCNIVNAKLNNDMYSDIIDWEVDVTNICETFHRLFAKLIDKHSVKKLNTMAKSCPLVKLKYVPAKLRIDISVQQLQRLILDVNNLVPFSEKAVVLYTRRMLKSNYFSFGEAVDSLCHYKNSGSIVALATVEDAIFELIEKMDFNIDNVHRRMCGLLMSTRRFLTKDVHLTHLSNVHILFENNDIIQLEAYIRSYTYLGDDGKLYLSDAAAAPRGVITSNKVTHKKQEPKSESNIKKFYKVDKVTVSLNTLTVQQRGKVIAGALSIELSRIEKTHNIVYTDETSKLIIASEIHLSSEKMPRLISKAYLSNAISGARQRCLIVDDREQDAKVAAKIMALAIALESLYFSSNKKVDKDFLTNIGSGAVYTIPPPPMQWRKEMEAEYLKYAMYGITIDTAIKVTP